MTIYNNDNYNDNNKKKNKHYCVLSNSGLSNATSKRPKLVKIGKKIADVIVRQPIGGQTYTHTDRNQKSD